MRSLGWVEMSEEDMAPGKSSVAVNNCIRQLSYHKHNLHDTAGIWGEVRGKTESYRHFIDNYCNVCFNVDTFKNGVYLSASFNFTHHFRTAQIFSSVVLVVITNQH